MGEAQHQSVRVAFIFEVPGAAGLSRKVRWAPLPAFPKLLSSGQSWESFDLPPKAHSILRALAAHSSQTL